jgi:hypothetical protein
LRADSVTNLSRGLERRLKPTPALSGDLAGILRRAIAQHGGKPQADLVRNSEV